jgi:CheY-like chemotaxis protein
MPGAQGHVLIVEDEPLVALLVEEMVQELGFASTKTVTSLADALESAAREELCFAILDVNLQGKKSYEVADVLTARHIPFAFASGALAPGSYAAVPILPKPFSLTDVEKVLGTLINAENAHPDPA